MQEFDRLLVSVKNIFDYRVQEWLNSKVDDPRVEHKYDFSIFNEGSFENTKNNVHHIFDFYNYYYEDDQDIIDSDHFYIDTLKYLRENDPEEITKEYNLRVASIVEERYVKPEQEVIKNDGWAVVGKQKKKEIYLEEYPENISVLIAPNTNRARVNYLFKKMIDYCIDNKKVYGKFNTSDSMPEGEDKNELIFNRDMKDNFYNLCYKSSLKKEY